MITTCLYCRTSANNSKPNSKKTNGTSKEKRDNYPREALDGTPFLRKVVCQTEGAWSLEKNLITTCCWWKKYQNNHLGCTISTGAGFLPSTGSLNGTYFLWRGIKLEANVVGNFFQIVHCWGWEYNDPQNPPSNYLEIDETWWDWKIDFSFGPETTGGLLVLGSVTHNSVGDRWRWIFATIWRKIFGVVLGEAIWRCHEDLCTCMFFHISWVMSQC